MCIYENKDADQLRGNREADLRLCFGYINSTIPLLSKYEFKPLAILCGCTAWFVSDLVGNPKNGFSHDEAHKQTTGFLIMQLSVIADLPVDRHIPVVHEL